MDVDPPPSFGAPGDPPGGTNLNLQQLLDLVHYFPPLSPKQGGKDLSIVWKHSLCWLVVISRSQSHNVITVKKKKKKNQYNCHGKTNETSGMLHHMEFCKKWSFLSRPKSMDYEFRCMTNLLILYLSINVINSKISLNSK